MKQGRFRALWCLESRWQSSGSVGKMSPGMNLLQKGGHFHEVRFSLGEPRHTHLVTRVGPQLGLRPGCEKPRSLQGVSLLLNEVSRQLGSSPGGQRAEVAADKQVRG